MSALISGMVFARYPMGGNELLLALALADHAHDDGTHIFPSVNLLAKKTRQSERTVQRCLAAMVEVGWLLLVRRSSGRPGVANEYKISPQWLAGAALPDRALPKKSANDGGAKQTGDKLTPVQAVDNCGISVDKVIHTGDNGGDTGDTAMSPESPITIIKEPPYPPLPRGDDENLSSQEKTSNTQTERALRAGGVRLGVTAHNKPGWRWRDTRSGVEDVGQRVGVGRWDSAAFDRGEGELFSAYEARVIAAVEKEELHARELDRLKRVAKLAA